MSDVPASQKNEAFDEPSRDEIPGISRQHTAFLETTDAEEAWIIAGMDHVILHTIGRKSGNEHKVTLPFWYDPEGRRVVVGSFSGAPEHPAWYLNLADRTANPKVKIRVRGGLYECDAVVLEGEERQRIWDLLTTDREYYRDYQSRTDRELPLVRFENLVEIS
ncbi:nitroreductase/quinone reductase family protein [Rhabdothermincola salaria]|uniref:nitroreductase/quinone reductase family protein n=1 Tax=Rhabdothermincola salaria TaxID=2903142 RepID=UPI001E5C68C9|nr:nitroreductase/quinone reductase family protein [Rhabdothermincola salaria]MCD9624685.1 nitroreductase family deazaflavin-dependent oxidoreductase [Rhabdothermincola salaria]